MTRFVSAMVALVLSSGAAAAGLPDTTNYPGYWQEEFNLDIVKAIAWNKIGGCGGLSHRRSKTDPAIYLVRCVGSSPSPTFFEVSTKSHTAKPANMKE